MHFWAGPNITLISGPLGDGGGGPPPRPPPPFKWLARSTSSAESDGGWTDPDSIGSQTQSHTSMHQLLNPDTDQRRCWATASRGREGREATPHPTPLPPSLGAPGTTSEPKRVQKDTGQSGTPPVLLSCSHVPSLLDASLPLASLLSSPMCLSLCHFSLCLSAWVSLLFVPSCPLPLPLVCASSVSPRAPRNTSAPLGGGGGAAPAGACGCNTHESAQGIPYDEYQTREGEGVAFT